MTKDKDKNVKIEINIAGEILKLTVPSSDQESLRKSERAINEYFSDWRNQFPRKTNSEIMAMVAFQFAKYYHELSGRYDALLSRLDGISARLDSLLAETAD